MMLTGGWAATTSLFLISGFVVGWHRGRLIYRSQLPVPSSGNVAERLLAALERRTAPPEPEKQDPRHPVVPFILIFFQTWGLWMLSGQIVYWGVKVTIALVDTDIEATVSHIASFWWLLPVAFAVAALTFVAWYFTRSRKEGQDVPHEPRYLTPVQPQQAPPMQPVQQQMTPQPAVGWSLDPNAEHWATRPTTEG